MNRSGSIAVAVASTAVVVAGIATVASLALLPAQNSGAVANVASIVISPKDTAGPTVAPTNEATPAPGTKSDDHGGAVAVTPAAPAVVVPTPEPSKAGDDDGDDDNGGQSGKGSSGSGSSGSGSSGSSGSSGGSGSSGDSGSSDSGSGKGSSGGKG